MIYLKQNKIHARGQSIIELLITMALMAILLPAIIGGFIASREGKTQDLKIKTAKEALSSATQAILLIRDKGFESIATNGLYYIKKEGNSFSLTTDPQPDVNGVLITVEIKPILRNAEQTIVSENGIIDPASKKIILNASWDGLFQNNIQTTLVLTRNFPNASFIQTTKDDFSAGNLQNTLITEVEDGEIVLTNNQIEGVYESSVIDLGYTSALNTILPKVETPIGTKIEYQVSLTDAVSENCNESDFFYTGPDGTDQTYYTGSQMIKFDDDGAMYENPGRCFRYKAYLKSEIIGESPIFKSLSVNFSP